MSVVRLVDKKKKKIPLAILSSIQACLSLLSILLRTSEVLMLATFTMATND